MTVFKSCVGLFCALSATIAWSADGDLDVDFGQMGYAGLNLAQAFGASSFEAPVIRLAPDGGIYLVGAMSVEKDAQLQIQGYVARFTSTGMLDNSFASGDGVRAVELPENFYQPRAAAIAPDGGIVMSGYRNKGGVRYPTVCKLKATGEMDAGFGQEKIPGCYSFDVTGGSLHPISPHSAVVADSKGGYFVAMTRLEGQSYTTIAISRLDSAGNIDQSFGSNGFLNVDAGVPTAVHQIALHPDGSPVVSGILQFTPLQVDVMVLKAAAGGGSFNAEIADLALHPQYSREIPEALAIRSNGDVVIAGRAWNGSAGAGELAFLLRYDQNLDQVKPVSLQFPSAEFDPKRQAFELCGGCALQRVSALGAAPDGGLFLAGEYRPDMEQAQSIFILRLRDDWTVDSSFGDKGVVTLDFSAMGGDDIDAYQASVGVTCDGRPVIAGRHGANGGGSRIGMTRLTSASLDCQNGNPRPRPRQPHHPAPQG